VKILKLRLLPLLLLAHLPISVTLAKMSNNTVDRRLHRVNDRGRILSVMRQHRLSISFFVMSRPLSG